MRGGDARAGGYGRALAGTLRICERGDQRKGLCDKRGTGLTMSGGYEGTP